MRDDVSKKDLKALLLSHERRESKEQEAAESPKEQKLEAKVGLHEDHEEKKAFWRGFEKRRG
jgi:hypothetical protein